MISETCCNIVKAGWLEFKSNIGDHRVAYIDIKTSDLINKNKLEIVSRKARKLQIKHEKCVARYIKTCEKEFKREKLIKQTITIRSLINQNRINDAIKLLEKVDKTQTKIVLKAERKCRKRLTGQVLYAPDEVQHFGRLINFWSMIID